MKICTHRPSRLFKTVIVLMFLLITANISADPLSIATEKEYRINPGDVISVLVWDEQTLSQPEVIVNPDGYISVPMIGRAKAGGATLLELQESIAGGLKRYMRVEPNVTVSVVQLSGNSVYVLGKVNRPGQFIMTSTTDVTQALALAGGLNTFASEDGIKILRRNAAGVQTAIAFDYDDVKSGKNLDVNITLQSGDIVIVP